MEQYKAGQHVFIRVPSISLVSHPFTVNRVVGESHSLRIMFKENGPFTKSLSDALLNNKTPLLQLDGFHGSNNRVEDALQHNVIVFIAGGIGIVAHLSIHPK
jgi:predicted ferric reductase